ncbi:molybdopterin synthase sulphurylase protein,putative [Trypanosoma brucei gambiense DAL972]|uniref:Adenylyltransferase and sulfurtransferase MOCS3 homolog n=1 Tax=Trypanosoma brucei gambiense (strain MHOM/CI/86/DAL972) TaxID=679716 RepID=D0A640_TRYB9|nr:molybdopterin synthase sulphurylase protein,putative [Trypanosoma brucei gambiense DAL972]CBH17141.1 molybdopterin synthase sulphurylase protein,putative [Trypanosoma brucei gambiense DAL972]|eukprot:XP_011779405.1 molybdopterin synthase sulphurylase protein,putative [Trypanosoma brucei gambiense DAL972]
MNVLEDLEAQVATARLKLHELEERLHEERNRVNSCGADVLTSSGPSSIDNSGGSTAGETPPFVSSSGSLTKSDVERFSRQIVLEDIGAKGMDRIRRGRVLLVGAGGLGSTAALYLVAAGVGELCIVDFDTVEHSNLHRQIIHNTMRVGMSKAESAVQSCLALNPRAKIRAITAPFTPANAEELVRGCDVVVDGSDNVATRYLINDAAARYRRPLVSGSALRWEGQLSVYCGGLSCPCYRCLFPTPPPASAVGSCNDTGVVGPVPGCIGCLQATEALKLLAGAGDVLEGRLLLLDALRMQLRVVRLRGRQKDCPACGEAAKLNVGKSLQQLAAERPEYVMPSCASGALRSANMLPAEANVAPSVYFSVLQKLLRGERMSWMTLDVRPKEQYDMAHLPHSVSLPLKQLEMWKRDGVLQNEWEKFVNSVPCASRGPMDVYVICRRGISSVKAMQVLLPLQEWCPKSCGTDVDGKAAIHQNPGKRFRFINVDGGLNRYHREVDRNFPFY